MSTWALAADGHEAEARRSFDRRIDGLWDFRGAVDLRVEIEGHVLARPDRVALRTMLPFRFGSGLSVDELACLLDAGHVFGSDGRLRLSKRLDVDWQDQVLSFYEQVRGVLATTFGYQVFLCYGTLLGVARDGDFIGYDDDFDAAYVSQHRDPHLVVQEVGSVAKALIDSGLDVECLRTTLHVYHPVDRRTRIDLYHLYFDESGELAFPFGVAGTSVISAHEWACVPFDLHGREVIVPADMDALAAHIYGDGWRLPDPAFEWARSRRRFAAEVVVPPRIGDEVHRYAVKARNGLLRAGMTRWRTRLRRRAKRLAIRWLPSPLRGQDETASRAP